MKLRFTKMHGAGNDFVVFDGVSQRVELTPERIRRIADRHLGIGCDQILLVEPPSPPSPLSPLSSPSPAGAAGADFRYRIFNADGGEVEQCGNGARCFARFVRDRGLTEKSEIRVETLSGVISPRLEADGKVTVDMGAPIFEPARVPFVADADALVHEIDVGGHAVAISVLSMGNPHAVQIVDDVNAAPVTTEGPQIENHARFPQRVNAGYMQVLDRSHIRLRVWERGAGETLACGTGACAAVVAGIRRGVLVSPVRVQTRGGELTVSWDGGDDVNSGKVHAATVRMTGPAETVFEGEIKFDEC